MLKFFRLLHRLFFIQGHRNGSASIQKIQTGKYILIALNQGFAFRYFVQTDIIKYLTASGHRLIILVPDPDDPYFSNLNKKRNITVEKYNVDDCRDYLRRNPVERWLKTIRFFVLNAQFDIRTTEDFYKSYIEDQKELFKTPTGFLRKIMLDWIIISCRKFRFVRRLILYFEQLLFSPSIHKGIFDFYEPQLLITYSLGTFDYDQFLMREAAKRHIKIVSVILSWDNTTTRGMPGATADRVIAWTETMKQELEDLNDIDSDRIKVGGVAHFDHYFRKDTFMSRERLCEKLNLDHNKKILFFVTKSPNSFPWNAEIAEMIAKAIQNSEIVDPCQLLIRIHPLYFRRQNGKYTYQPFIDHLHQVAQIYADLKLNRPKMISTKDLDYLMPDEEIRILASILKYSSVVINMFSTLNIEASIFDIPIVNVCFEGSSYEGYKKARHNITLDEMALHNQRILQSNGIAVVRNRHELIREINEALLYPLKFAAGRKVIKEKECGPHLGNAGKEIVSFILDLL